jgi:release factor glutamine methyltransferase
VSTADPDHGVPVDTVGTLMASVSSRLAAASEARWIVAQAAALAPGQLLAAFDTAVSPEAVEAAQAMTERRVAGEPLQYVLGTWSFRHLEVVVDARALVPRPETEQVVEAGLVELRRLSGLPGRTAKGMTVVDLGTGSGVIALSMARETTGDVEVWATDASPAALALAGANLSRLADSHPGAAARVRLAEGSWFGALPDALRNGVQLVVSNPPYVSAAEWTVLDPEIRDHEPRAALVPGPSGLEALEVLIEGARRWLAPGGSLVLEMAPHQATAVRTMAERAGYVDVGVRPDLAGRDRILVASRPRG